ncbi:hypothetical protein HPULCUR_011395 [Helicostylum pulchrum]|uniref:C2H2-type domain-containing protein n=1 Tax=Helicostylum pulchrum TaxID=562976 RepID=A0ABP9YFY1_9FUNG
MSQSFFSIHANATFCNICNIEFATLSNFSRHQREIHDRGSSQYNDVSENDNQHSVEELVDDDAYFDSCDEDDADNVQYLSDKNDESASESNDEEVEGFNTYQSTSVWSSNPYYPFKNEMEMKVLMFFKGSQDRFSNRIIKKTMHLMRQLVLISHQERDLIQQRPEGLDPLRNVPKDDQIFKSHNTKRKFPRLEVDKAVIPKENGQSVDLFLIKPSNHLRLIMANTQKIKLLKSLPDFTPNQRYHPSQGRKWKENCHFQSPMVTKEIANTSNDFWIGDVVRTSGDQQQMYIIVSFFTVDSQIFISGFPMEFFENFQAAAFGSEKVNVPVSNIAFCMSITEPQDQCQQQLSSKLIRSDGEICYTPFNQLLTPHYNLIAESLAI